MILEAIFGFGLWIFEFLVEAMPALQPTVYSAASALGDLLGFGIWVIGEPVWELIIFFVNGWITYKCAMGAVLFVYRLIPII